MFKIQNNFWIDILEKRKTLEFRKVNKLSDIIENSNIYINGRIGIEVFDIETKKKLGNLIFNGYKIIDKDYLFNFIDEYLFARQKDNLFYEITTILGIQFLYQFNWIKNNLDWLKEYYKNETEILILYIESFEENKNE